MAQLLDDFRSPERRNAVTQGLQIGEILEDFGKDEAVRVVVLKGSATKPLCRARIAHHRRAAPQRRRETPDRRSTSGLTTFSKPTIAMIQGYRLGGPPLP